MGCRPGDWDESTFNLPKYEHMSNSQIAELICEHFSKISQEYSPLNLDLLPSRVLTKVKDQLRQSPAPKLTDNEVYTEIEAASKPKSGVPGDLPRRLIIEFSPEIAAPLCVIYNNIIESSEHSVAQWSKQLKIEHGTPIKKIVFH